MTYVLIYWIVLTGQVAVATGHVEFRTITACNYALQVLEMSNPRAKGICVQKG